MVRFKQVDVFGSGAFDGNPVAVVLDAEGMSSERMQQFARWTNLSETTFLFAPSDPAADYRVRIFTPAKELPFAGHPTLGSAHAWLESGGVPKRVGGVIQECGVGLVELTIDEAEGLAFAAPPLLRSGAVDSATRNLICAVANIDPADIVSVAWVDNGPGWVGVELADASAVLAVTPNLGAASEFDIGLVGFYPEGTSPVGAALEVRAFFASEGVALEDPVTGSLQASLAQWLIGERKITAPYVATQGQKVGAAGRVVVSEAGGRIWIGGRTHTYVDGTLDM